MTYIEKFESNKNKINLYINDNDDIFLETLSFSFPNHKKQKEFLKEINNDYENKTLFYDRFTLLSKYKGVK